MSTTMQGEGCGNCRFWTKNGFVDANNTAFGACRKEPPKVFLLGVIQPQVVGQRPSAVTESFWPTLPEIAWCGDWQAAPRNFATLDLSKLRDEGTA